MLLGLTHWRDRSHDALAGADSSAPAQQAGSPLGRLRTLPQRAAAQDPGTVGLPCKPCNCTDNRCDCCLIGITGGGVVRTQSGDVNLVLFATQLAADAPQEAAGFVRWLDPNAEGGLTLESVGPIAYTWPEGEEHLRNVTGVMTVNGEDQQPFQLEVFDAGPGSLVKTRRGSLSATGRRATARDSRMKRREPSSAVICNC